MFGRTPKVLEQKLDDVEDRILEEMLEYGPDSEEYPKLMSQLERLTEVRKSKGKKMTVSLDNVILVAGNLLGILVIVAYEQKHVFVSKAVSFVRKP